MKERVFVVIVSFNGGERLIKCVESVSQLSIIVVDNASTDSSKEKIKNLKCKMKNYNSKFKIILNQKNLGFSGGVNLGIKYALKNEAEYVILLNQDAIVEKDAVEKLAKVMEEDKKIGICGPLILTPDKNIWSAGGVVDKKRYTGGHLFKIVQRESYEVDFISGCCMMIKNKVFEKIGFFDERFFLYYEDVDFCLRAERAGFKVALVPKALVYHQLEDGEQIRQYFMAKSHLLFLEKHAPLKIKIREMVRLPKTIYEHLRRGERQALLGIRDYFLKQTKQLTI